MSDGLPKKNFELLKVGLIFLLGSLFYPKDMAQLYRDPRLKLEIKRLHDGLYKFSIKNLDYLMSWMPFRFIMLHYI
jgi:hypothetical protein